MTGGQLEFPGLAGVPVTVTGLAGPVSPGGALGALRAMRRVTTAARWVTGDLAWAVIDNDPTRLPELFQHLAGLDVDDRPALMASLAVAQAFPVDARYPALSWSHHKAVMGRSDGDEWLARAVDEGWSVHAMVEAIKATEQPDRRPLPGLSWHTEHASTVKAVGRWLAEHRGAVVVHADGTWRPLGEPAVPVETAGRVAP